MESDAAPTSLVLPRSAPFEPSRASVSASSEVHRGLAADRTDRNEVFGQLVREDSDIAGLVAYSIYKQHKLDWLRAFENAKGRAPNDDELASYIIGEGTPRRLATYRHLAEATLAGNGPEVDGAIMPAARSIGAGRRAGRLGSLAPATVALYAVVAVLFVIGFYLALHFTATTR